MAIDPYPRTEMLERIEQTVFQQMELAVTEDAEPEAASRALMDDLISLIEERQKEVWVRMYRGDYDLMMAQIAWVNRYMTAIGDFLNGDADETILAQFDGSDYPTKPEGFVP